MINYSYRIRKDFLDYIKGLGKMFTPRDFFNHSCFVFNRYYKKLDSRKEILIKIFIENLKEELSIEDINHNKLYFIDTNIEDAEEEKINENQEVIDIILKQIKIDVDIFDSMNIQNLNFE